MALVTRRISDITGAEGADEEFAAVTVRQHPKFRDPKRLDALPGELGKLKAVSDLVILEVKMPDGTTNELYIRYADFVKVVPDEVVDKAPGTRGRIPGYRPSNNSAS
jgi:hypothetical protein